MFSLLLKNSVLIALIILIVHFLIKNKLLFSMPKIVKKEESEEEKLEKFVSGGKDNLFPLLDAIKHTENKTCNVREAKNRLYLDGIPETSKAPCCNVKDSTNDFKTLDNKKFDTIHFHRPGNDNKELYDYVYSTDDSIDKFFKEGDETLMGAETEKEGTGYTGIRGSEINDISCSDNCGVKCQTDFEIKDNLKTTTLTASSIDNYFSKNKKTIDGELSKRDPLIDQSNNNMMFINNYKDEAVINGGSFAKSSAGSDITGFDNFMDNFYSV